jgi:hypothetical protein
VELACIVVALRRGYMNEINCKIMARRNFDKAQTEIITKIIEALEDEYEVLAMGLSGCPVIAVFKEGEPPIDIHIQYR